jgi:transcriptional regulator with XRE-family HTH domain
MVSLRHRFGKRLRYLRRRAGFTQERLAESAEISVDFISLVERGINAPSFENLEKIAKALGISVRELFEFEEHS